MILQGEIEKSSHIYYEYDKASSPIGIGGMGTVYKGRMVDVSTGAYRDVAIKEIHVEGTQEEQAVIVERAKREAMIRISNDNLVEMLGFVEIEDNKLNFTKKRYYVISEFLNGVTLDKVLEGDYANYCGETVGYASEIGRKYQMDREDMSCFIIKNVLSAIMALHDKGYLHRDIDPSNIMITDDGKIKLIDYGIAKQISDLTTSDNQKLNGSFVGKVEYAAPEQISGDISKQDITTDIYSVGVLFFRLLTGNLPFEGNRFEIVQGHTSKRPKFKKIASRKYKSIVSKALAKSQKKRYQSSASMRSALDGSEPAPKILFYAAGVVLTVLTVWIIKKVSNSTTAVLYGPPSIEINKDNSNTPIISQESKASVMLPTIDVAGLLDKDIKSIWSELDKNPNNPVALYCVASHYRNHSIKDDEKTIIDTYWKKHLEAEGDVNEFIINDKSFSRLRLCYVALCRARKHLSDYNYSDVSIIEKIDDMIKEMASDKKNGGDNFRIQF